MLAATPSPENDDAAGSDAAPWTPIRSVATGSILARRPSLLPATRPHPVDPWRPSRPGPRPLRPAGEIPADLGEVLDLTDTTLDLTDATLAGTPADAPDSRWLAIWQHRPYLLAIARKRVPWHDAEDVVHEAFLRAVRDVFIPEARLKSWLVTTTLRLCADRHRDDASQRRRRLLHGARPETLTAVGPEDEIVDAAEAAWVAEQVELLPERQAQAVRLRAEGLSLAEVGAEMGVPAKSVESLLGRARRVLKAAAAAAAAILIGTKVLVKRKTQVHVAALAIGAACSGGMYCLEAGSDAASAGVKEVGTAVGPHWHRAMQWAGVDKNKHITTGRHETGVVLRDTSTAPKGPRL